MRIAILEHHLLASDAEVIPLARQLGFEGLELSFGAYGPGARLMWQPDGPERIRQLASEHQVALCSLSAGYFNRHGLIDPQPEGRKRAAEMLSRLIDGCGRMGVPLLQVPCYAANELRGPSDERLMAEVVGPLVERAVAGNVRVAFETLLPAEDFRQFLDRFHGPAVFACYDVANARAVGRDVTRELKVLSDRLGLVHVKDRDRQEPFVSVALGAGIGDWPSVIRTLAEMRYSGWLVLDTPSGDDPVASARANLEYLRGLMATCQPTPSGQAARPAA